MSESGTRIDGSGRKRANPFGEFILWQEIATAWGNPTLVPSIEAMEQMRLHLLDSYARPDRDSAGLATSMRIATELGRRGDTPRPQEAWRSLRALADDLDFSRADIGGIGPQIATSKEDAGREGPATGASAEPDSYIEPSSDDAARLWKELRAAWSQGSSVPSAASQRLLLDALQAKGGDDLASRFGGEIAAISGWIASADNKNRKTAWSALAAIARWFSFRDMTIRQVILGHLPPEALVQGDVPDGTANPEFDVLARICDKAVTIKIGGRQAFLRYPSRIPRAWLSSGRADASTVVEARGADWQLIDVSGCKFLIPPEEILGMLLSACDYERFVRIGIASRSGMPHTSGLLSSALEDFISVLETICAKRLNPDDRNAIYAPDDFSLSSSAGFDDIVAVLRDGYTLIYADGRMNLVPPSAIGSISGLDRNVRNDKLDPRMLLRLGLLGIIGIRGGPNAPWWGLRGEDAADSDPLTGIAIAFRAPNPSEVLFGRLEWSGGGHGRAVEIGHHRASAVYPLIEQARTGFLSRGDFSDALSQADAMVYGILQNMIRPDGAGRKTCSVLAREMGVSASTALRWEALLEELCRHCGWGTSEKNESARLSSQGKKHAKQLDGLIARVSAERLSYEEFVRLLRESGDLLALGVFLDLTAPAGGRRMTVKGLAGALGTSRPTIDRMQNVLSALCREMEWNIAPGGRGPSDGSSGGSPANGGPGPAGPPATPMAGPPPPISPAMSGNPIGLSALQFVAGCPSVFIQSSMPLIGGVGFLGPVIGAI